MKKLLWFTKDQAKQLEAIKEMTGQSNSEIVRDGIDLYYKQLLVLQKTKVGGEK